MHNSPFEKFRENQKYWMAVLAILSMISFVIIPAAMKFGGQAGPSGSPEDRRSAVVVESKFGNITQFDLQRETADRQIVARFLSTVEHMKWQKMLDLYKNDPAKQQRAYFALNGLNNPQFRMSYPSRPAIVFNNFRPESEQTLAYQILTEKEAEEFGITVTEEMALDYIKKTIRTEYDQTTTPHRPLCQVSSDEIDALVSEFQQQNHGFNYDKVIKQVENFLLRDKFGSTGLQASAIDPPLKRWENYLRINRRAGVEIVPVNVENFVDKIEDPKEDELQKFFNERKGKTQEQAQFENPDEFGFRLPERASFQFYFINEEKLTASYKPTVTDKEIEDYYTKNKSQFPKEKLPELKDDKSPDAKKGDSKDAPRSETPKKDEGKSDPTTPPTVSPAPKTDEKQSLEKKPDTKSSDATAPSAPAKGTPPSSSNDERRKTNLFASYVVPVAYQAPTPANDATKPAPSTTTQPAPMPAGNTNPDPVKPEPAKPDAAKPDASLDVVVEYEPLEKVRDKIITALATERANARRDELIEKLRNEMVNYADNYRDEINILEHEQNKAEKKVPPFDMEKLKSIDPTIQYGELPLISYTDLRQVDLGKSSVFAQAYKQNVNMAMFAFMKDSAKTYAMHLYSPQKASSISSQYLVWKTEMKPEEESTLADKSTRERVIHAWKFIKARDLAKAEAQKYAEKAKAEKKKFTDLTKEMTDMPAPFVEPGFSWIIPGGQGMQRGEQSRPELSSLPSVDGMSNEFMQTVFHLDEGGTGVAMNNKKSVAYAIYVTYIDKPEKFETSYLQDVRTSAGYDQYANANLEEARELFISANQNLRKRIQYREVRPLKESNGQEE